MEITKENFTESLPSVSSAIDKADFIAVDAEFTGLRRQNAHRYCELDTLEERYSKVKEAAKDFGMIQFGMTAFHYVKEKASYSHSTFCFYLLGRTREICYYDSSSLRFLANNGFDFNKLFKSGLSYLSLKEEADRRAEYSKQGVELVPPSPVKVTEEGAKKFLEEVSEKVEKFLGEEDVEELTLPGDSLSGFYRKLLYNNIAAKYKNILIRSISTDLDRYISIRKFDSPESRVRYLEEERNKKLEEEVGFSHVIHKILESGKPVVGHNMILDLMHIIEKMVQPLPEHLDQFKHVFLSICSTIYDTKHIARDPPFCVDIPNTSLGVLYSELCDKFKPPQFITEAGLPSHSVGTAGQAHDAGYDAFMTGVCFITMVKHLDGKNWKNCSVVKSKHLVHYANRLHIMNTHDLPTMNLTGPDMQPERSHIFCVDCPADWNNANVYSIFHMLKPIKIVWVNSNSLYVVPLEEIDTKKCKQYLKAILACCPPLVQVRLYGEAVSCKRKSQSDEFPVLPPTTASRTQEFKRLRSVGSDQLSQMSLESPSTEDPPPPPSHCPKAGKNSKKEKEPGLEGVFTIPDEW